MREPSYLPEHLTREIPHPERAKIIDLYNDRVRDATKMLIRGDDAETVREKHGRFVLQDAMTKWSEFWARFRFDTEGRAVLRRVH